MEYKKNHKFIVSSRSNKDVVKLREERTLMLKLSENDIKSGKLISQSQLDKRDWKWVKERKGEIPSRDSISGHCKKTTAQSQTDRQTENENEKQPTLRKILFADTIIKKLSRN